MIASDVARDAYNRRLGQRANDHLRRKQTTKPKEPTE